MNRAARIAVICILAITGCAGHKPKDADERFTNLDAAMKQSNQQPRQNPDYDKLVYPQREDDHRTRE